MSIAQPGLQRPFAFTHHPFWAGGVDVPQPAPDVVPSPPPVPHSPSTPPEIIEPPADEPPAPVREPIVPGDPIAGLAFQRLIRC